MAVATGTAILAGTALAAAGTVTASLIASDASRDAAREQRKALREARVAQEQGVARAEELNQPFLELGTQAFNNLADIIQQQVSQPSAQLQSAPTFSFSQEDIQSDPGVQFAQNEARRAVEASAASRGGVLSGGTLQDLQNRASGLASLQTQDAFNRKLAGFQSNVAGRQLSNAERQQAFANRQTNLSNLAQIAQVGPQTASNLGNIAIGQAGRAGDLGIQLGNVNAANRVAQGQALSQGIQGGANSLRDLILLQSVLGSNNVGSAPISGGNIPIGTFDLPENRGLA